MMVKTVKMGMLVSRPPVSTGQGFFLMEPAVSCDLIYGHCSITFPPVYLGQILTISATDFGRSKRLYKFCVIL